MVGPPPDPKTQDDMGVGPVHESPPGTPRWVKIFGIIILLLILGFLILKLAGVGGDHGPGRHASSDDIGRVAVSDGVDGTAEDTTADTEPFGSSRADVFGGQTVAFVATTVSQAIHKTAPFMNAAVEQVRDYDPLDHVTQGLTGVLQA